MTELTKEFIVKNTSENELFALFHAFKEHFNEMLKEQLSETSYALYCLTMRDEQIAAVIKRLKKNYR